MLTLILAVLGLGAGLIGLAVGGWALLSARKSLHDTRSLIRRLLPEGGGVDPRAVRDVGLVRYDALEEMTGARSFSLALLNASGDGAVLTSINGRTEARTYAKAVSSGRPDDLLSPEEYRAVRAARLGHGLDTAPRGAAAPIEVPAARQAPQSKRKRGRQRAEQHGRKNAPREPAESGGTAAAGAAEAAEAAGAADAAARPRGGAHAAVGSPAGHGAAAAERRGGKGATGAEDSAEQHQEGPVRTFTARDSGVPPQRS